MTETRAPYTVIEDAVSEADWQRTITDYLTLRGWLWWHPLPARTATGWHTATQGTPGWPDLTAVRDGRLVLIELKSKRWGKLSPAQERWIAALRQVPGIEVYVWRPSDWTEAERILA